MDLTDEQIDDLVSLGYDLHIHDQSGTYPDGLDRDEWETRETEKILRCHLTNQPSGRGKRICPICGAVLMKNTCWECVGDGSRR